jgi:hypothetical protein
MENLRSIKLSYLLLLIVMGGRTALFVSHFDSLKVGSFDITPLSFVFALALILAVAGGAYARGATTKNDRKHSTATRVMFGAAILDGWFNVSEAVILADRTGVFNQFAANRPVLYWMWATAVLVGVGPTLLTMGLATLAGEVDRTTRQQESNVRTHTKVAVAIERTTETNPALDAHLTKVVAQLTPGQEFGRAQIEQWAGVSKQHAVNIVNYAKTKEVFGDVRRGVYVYKGEETDNGRI